ncbi:MAG: nucleoside deaminase [Cyanobacteria bacterium]|jgi:cytosine deaminase|nr:nucleoside deaminase [Cyanobacteria bacterium GSL.Bin21]
MSNSNLSISINYWKNFLESYGEKSKSHEAPDDGLALETCQLALHAVECGNFGIGSMIVNSSGYIVARGSNQVFHPYFRSDRHAEMVAMEEFEENYQRITTMKGYTLFTSLEPCPMCLTRLVKSGCEKIVHIADDPLGGMVHLKQNLSPIWIELAQEQTFSKANCSVQLQEAAKKISMLNLEELHSKLMQRRK